MKREADTRGTTHSEELLDKKIEQINREITRLETIRREVEALGKRGNREQAFFAGRRSMAYELRESGGLAASRLGTEILFLLPDDFVQFYGSLFHRALAVGDSSVMHGRSGGLEKAGGNTGTVTGSDNKLQASGTGKRFKNTPIAIGNETWLKAKQRLDGKLVQLVREFRFELTGGVEGGDIGLERVSNGQVSATKTTKTPQSSTHQCTNQACRRFLKAEWKHCPECGTRTVEAGGQF